MKPGAEYEKLIFQIYKEILFSTTVAPYDREKYRKLGAVDSIAKPSRFNEVVGVIRRLQVQR